MAKPTTKRCAIYTRKSSEEGLEQEYNSLDAQRDSGEAFIRSQKHEGWKLLKEGYDDGGISGGHMERPGLQQLLQDIKAGRIDVVVVYKVEVVHACFQTYLDSRGLIEAIQELNRRALRTKRFVSSKGRVHGDKPWVAMHLHRVLTQPIYRGKIQHRDELFDGEHDAIVDEELWNRVQKKLRENQPEFRKLNGHTNETAIRQTRLGHPLKGFVYSVDGSALTPTYTNKSSSRANGDKERKRYRYYVSQQAIRQGYQGSSITTLNATLLEEAVCQMLVQAIPDLVDTVSSPELTPKQVRYRLENHAARISAMESPLRLAEMIEFLSPKIVVGPELIQIHLPLDALRRLSKEPVDAVEPSGSDRSIPLNVTVEGEEAVISANVSISARRGRAEIVDGKTGKLVLGAETDPNPVLIRTLAQADYWRSELQKHPSKSLADVLKPYGLQPRHVRRVLNAAYLAPEIKRAIFQGTQPRGLQVQDLLRPRSMDWEEQMRELGFSHAAADATR